MMSLASSPLFDKLPIVELKEDLASFLDPITQRLPEKRLRQVCVLLVQGILAAKSPLITAVARSLERTPACAWPLARRCYRLLRNERFSYRDLLKGVGVLAQRTVRHYQPDRLVIAVDPVNLEKPYAQKLEGVSTVMKSTPPGFQGEKRLTSGYPTLTATVVNLPEPVLAYAHWFSYQTEDFTSENREIERALRTCRALFPTLPLRFVGDAGLDDQKLFRGIDALQAQFVIRVTHEERLVEVYNDRLDRWEREPLLDFAETLPLCWHWQVRFTHAHSVHLAEIALGWFQMRLPTAPQTPYWLLVAHDTTLGRDLRLLTNVPLENEQLARELYADWRCRTRIEHTYRFDQERGLDIEDIGVHTMERMRRLFLLVLVAALFVYHIAQTWAPPAIQWLLHLGGKSDLPLDADRRRAAGQLGGQQHQL